MDIQHILAKLPHRYPFLLVDRILDIDKPSQTIRALKNVTVNEPFFQGHFPGRPVMPGVLMLEALAQSSALLSFDLFDMSLAPDAVFYFVGIDNARFKKPVMAGDQLHLHVEIARQMRGIWKYKAEARVDGEVVAEAELMCAKRDVA